MSTIAQKVRARRAPTSAWSVPAALIALSLIPFVGGVARLVMLASNEAPTPDTERFVTAPAPVILHIIGALLFSILGAFQFSAGIRRRWPVWHRVAGRVLVIAGLVASLSGLWMTLFYDIPVALEGALLYWVRILVAIGMTAGLVLGLAAILRRDIRNHRAWLIRAYALGQGAGTQALIMLPWMLAFGEVTGLPRDILMSLSWLINIVIAEWIIRRQARN